LLCSGVKDIENKANPECEALDLAPQAPMVGPEIVHGIEINPLVAELARTTIWIGDIQWRRRNGIYHEAPPILRKLDAIECRDAILAKSLTEDPSHYAEAQWPSAEFIVGNPPFLGDRYHRRDLGEEYTSDLREVFEGRVPARADLVTYWFEKSICAVLSGATRAFGLVATKAITKGASRTPLERISNTKVSKYSMHGQMNLG
jgi:type II restriction/modification system DNA methylase subunit YeeA